MDTPDQLVAYARQIAIYRAYDNLEFGLQPMDVLYAKFDRMNYSQKIDMLDIYKFMSERKASNE